MTNSPYRARSARRPGRVEARAAVQEQDLAFRFLTQFAREPFTVGALWPSSKALSQVVVDSCDFPCGATVVELGPGTGAFTGALLDRTLKRGSRLVAVEINSTHARILRERFPRCEVVHGSAEELPRHLAGRRTGCIVSGLAWGNMLPRTQDGILQAVLDSLSPTGQFVAFAYVHAIWLPTSRRFRQRLIRNFRRVETSPIVWRNLPPAYVYRCWRG